MQDAFLPIAYENVSKCSVSKFARKTQILRGISDIDSSVVCVEASKAPVREKSAEGDNEGLKLEFSDENTMK